MSGGGGGNENDRGCFAEDSIVWIKTSDGRIIEKEIRDVKVGDQIQSVDPQTGQLSFTKVYFIMHDDDPNPYETVLIITFKNDANEEASLRITPNHLVYTTTGKNKPFSHPTKDPICARKIEVGDFLWVKNGEEFSPCSVTAITTEKNVKIINPLTMNHHIVVNGVHASVHVDNEELNRKLTAPLRFLFSMRPGFCTSRPVKAVNRLVSYKNGKAQDHVLPLQNTELSA